MDIPNQDFTDNPKPKLNLDWYKGEDLYSEGDVEDLIIQLIRENEPENYTDAIFRNFCWSTFYHLTHLRKNILNWYPFHKDADVLEIGCGLGAITSVLCENCKSVVSVELSKRRATAAQLRCREIGNLEIIVGNLNDIQFQKKFDYITLIGVLEYQGSYTETENPYLDFLKKIRTLLKPGGKLLIAIENQYGLKYWCGAREDHTQVPFSGINQYKINNNKTRTFSKADLDELIKQSGFKHTFFYYPMPDYKLPTVIYSQDHLPENANMQNMICYYAPDKKTQVAAEQYIYPDILKNQVFEFFANSFLVECTDSDEFGEVELACISSERIPEYRIGTRFFGKEKVEKFALGSAGNGHIQKVLQTQQQLKQRGLRVWEYERKDGKILCDYTDAKLWQDLILEAYQEKNIDGIYHILDLLYGEILKSSEEVSWEENILYTFPLGIKKEKEAYGPILKTAYIDMLLRNAFWINGQAYWFDQEWVLDNTPAKFVLYKAVGELYLSFPEMETVLPKNAVADRFGLLPVWDAFGELHKLFIDSVGDRKHFTEISYFQGSDLNVCVENIKKIL